MITTTAADRGTDTCTAHSTSVNHVQETLSGGPEGGGKGVEGVHNLAIDAPLRDARNIIT